ncbi:MAG: septation protein A [Legionellaceae bacterium]|nr:septation protein A [Legionellaceae bacterium]|tara:strand:- start:85 stop:615 length:531 start_codon:yes stop_codon:yes gene_type:complete
MQMLFEFLPIIVFFVVYKLNGIYAATLAAIIISALQVLFYWMKHKRVDRIQLGMLGLIVALGAATLILRKPIFIKWKPTVINWLFALLFFVTQYVGKQPLIEMMFQGKVQLPDPIWRRLNWLWIGFFTFVGFANIYVAYHYSTNTWVNFKLFGVLGLTVVFIVIQAFYLAKHMRET